MGGILPFGCIFIQLFFILNSIWSHQIYYMFGFLLLVALILIITCSETTILLCYFHLAAEDYNWWWRSFMTSGFTAVYFFVYAAHYYSSKVKLLLKFCILAFELINAPSCIYQLRFALKQSEFQTNGAMILTFIIILTSMPNFMVFSSTQ